MLKIYGSMLCPDCVQCRKELDSAGVSYEYLDFSENLKNLKEFLQLRDREPAFMDAKKGGRIGIPCILRPDGRITLCWDEFLNM